MSIRKLRSNALIHLAGEGTNSISCNPANNRQGEVHLLGLYRESWKSRTMTSAADVGVDEEQKTLVSPSRGSAPNAPGGAPGRGSLSKGPRRAGGAKGAGGRGPVNVGHRRWAGPGARALPGTDGRARTARVPGARTVVWPGRNLDAQALSRRRHGQWQSAVGAVPGQVSRPHGVRF